MNQLKSFSILVLFAAFAAAGCATVSVGLDSAVSEAAIVLSEKIPASSKIAVLNFISNDETTSYFILGKMLCKLSDNSNFAVIKRDKIESLQDTLGFSLSQNLNKKTQLSIGRELDAQIIISGSVSGAKDKRTLTIQALEVESAKIVASYKININEYQNFYESTNTDELIYGIGSAKMESPSMAITMAQTRARADISRKVNSVIQTSRNETTGGVETITTSNVQLSNSKILEMFFGDDGTIWVIMVVNKADTMVLNENEQIE